ncbi:GAP family protein [Arenivirga flava]|nr:GAP family protein [Arenivirga flava]
MSVSCCWERDCWSWPSSSRRSRRRGGPRPARAAARPGDGGGGTLPLLGLALGAGAVELATMLPYLGAIGIMTGAELPPVQTVTVLAGYCLLMVLPALVLLLGRTVAGRLVEPPLRRLAAWLERTGGETTAWIVGIVGFILAREAATALDLFDRIGELV